MTVTGLLLAAGAGRRMGGPKALLPDQDGRPLLARGVDALLDGGCDAVLVVTGAAAAEVADLLERIRRGRPVGSVTAEAWAEGMGASLRAGLGALRRSDASAAVVTLVDLADVGAPVVARVLRHVGATPTALGRAAYAGTPGHPVLIGRSHWDGVVAAARGDTGARDYLSATPHVLVECADLATGRDADTPADLAVGGSPDARRPGR